MSKTDSEDKVLNKKRERNSSSEETDVVYKPDKKAKIDSKKDKDKDKEKETLSKIEKDLNNFMASLD